MTRKFASCRNKNPNPVLDPSSDGEQKSHRDRLPGVCRLVFLVARGVRARQGLGREQGGTWGYAKVVHWGIKTVAGEWFAGSIHRHGRCRKVRGAFASIDGVPGSHRWMIQSFGALNPSRPSSYGPTPGRWSFPNSIRSCRRCATVSGCLSAMSDRSPGSSSRL